jgi:PAP2 superfamily
MRAVHMLLDPAIMGIASVFLAVLWMLKDQKDKTRPLLVFALIVNLFYGVLLKMFMSSEGGLFPWKYDHILFHIDSSLGLMAVSIAPLLQGPWRIPLWIIYQLMVPMMIVWFLVTSYRGPGRGSVVMAYIAELVTGPLIYGIVPACGPIYAFGTKWLNPPAVTAEAIRLTGMPNAFPSLHVATAFVFVFFAPGRAWKAVAVFFLAGTCLATLATGEHYVIDLIPGLAFGAFAASIGMQLYRRAFLFLSVVLTWSLAVRFGSSLLIASPYLTRAFALATVAIVVLALWKQWSTESKPAEVKGVAA